MEVRRIPCRGVTSLVIRPLGSTHPKLVGDGHIEVVPGSREQFSVTERDGWLFGRGVADMKTQVLIMMEALRQAIATGDGCDFWLVLTEDEEVGSPHGLTTVLEHLGSRDELPSVVLAPDGGPNFSFVEKEKGILQFEVHTHGTGGPRQPPLFGRQCAGAAVLDQPSAQGALHHSRRRERLDSLPRDDHSPKWRRAQSDSRPCSGRI